MQGGGVSLHPRHRRPDRTVKRSGTCGSRHHPRMSPVDSHRCRPGGIARRTMSCRPQVTNVASTSRHRSATVGPLTGRPNASTSVPRTPPRVFPGSRHRATDTNPASMHLQDLKRTQQASMRRQSPHSPLQAPGKRLMVQWSLKPTVAAERNAPTLSQP